MRRWAGQTSGGEDLGLRAFRRGRWTPHLSVPVCRGHLETTTYFQPGGASKRLWVAAQDAGSRRALSPQNRAGGAQLRVRGPALGSRGLGGDPLTRGPPLPGRPLPGPKGSGRRQRGTEHERAPRSRWAPGGGGGGGGAACGTLGEGRRRALPGPRPNCGEREGRRRLGVGGTLAGTRDPLELFSWRGDGG